LGKNTYLVFADAYKCFDKLWLKDCLVDLRGCGVREREIKAIYQLNESSRIKIDPQRVQGRALVGVWGKFGYLAKL